MASKVIGRVEIKVSAKVDNSRPDMQRDMDRQLDDMSRRANQRKPIKIKVDLDDEEVNRKLKELGKGKRESFKFVADFDASKVDEGLASTERKLKKVSRSEVKLDLDKGAFDSKMKTLNKDLKITGKLGVSEESIRSAERRVHEFKKNASDDIQMGVDLSGMSLAGARLSYLTRPRRASIIATVDAKSVAVAAGILKSLAGINTLQKFGRSVEDIVVNFDRFAGSITKTMTLVGSLTNTLGYMGTTLFSIGGGISQIIGLTAIVPTLAASLGSVIGVLGIGFNNFVNSFSDIPQVAEQALEKLPPLARRARDKLIGVFKDFQDPIQEKFWENMGDSIETFADVILPKVQQGLLEITPAVAKMTTEMLASFEAVSRNTKMQTMFENLAKGLEEATKGVRPFFDAINTLGFRGSYFLERMGVSLADMAKDFNEFIQHAEKMGYIEGWINSGMEALKDTWGVVVALKDQFKALTQIIDAAGGQSLDGFRRNMEGWARVMESEPFRSNMVKIFRGAREGAGELMDGIKALADEFGNAASFVEAFEIQLGRLGGGALSRIADILGRPMLQAGLLNGLLEVERALDLIQPSARNVGDTLGLMFDIAGNTLLGVVPMLNQVTGILRNIAFELGPSLKELIPTLTSFLRNFIEIFGGGLELATTVLGGVLDVVNALPGPLQNLALAFGTFLALRGRLGGMMTALDSFWNKQRTNFSGGVAVVESNAQRMSKAYDGMVTRTSDAMRRMSTSFRTALGREMWERTLIGTRYLDTFVSRAGGAATRFETAMGKIKTAASGLGRALSGIMSFGGGLGAMAVFTAIIAGISAIGAAARKEKESVEQLGATLDDFGNLTKASAEANAKWLTETTVGWGNAGATIKDALESIGISAQDALRGLSGNSEEYGALIKRITSAIDENKRAGDEFFNSAIDGSGQLSQENQRIYNGYLDQGDALNGLKREVEGYQRIVDLARQKQKDIAEAMGITNRESATLDDAIRTLGDEYADAGDKATAMSRALDILNGSLSEQDDATIAAADSARRLRETIKNLTTGDNKISLKDMIDPDTGKIDLSFSGDPTGAFAEVHRGMVETVQDGIAKGIRNAESAPPAGKLTALRAAYEEAVRGIRADIVPQLGKNGNKKFDAWLKEYGLDWDTVELLATGKLDEASMAKIPPEARELLKGLIGSDPFVDVPIDGDYLPLQGKMTVADAMLAKLGATETTPKIGADDKPLSKAAISAMDKLRTISNADAKAIIDGDVKPLTEKEQIALRKLMGIDSIEAVPTLDANGKPLDDEVFIAQAMLLGFSKKEATAMLKANKKDVDEKTASAQKKVDSVKQKRAVQLDANGNPLKDQTRRSQADIDRIKQKNKPKIDANGKPAKNEADSVKRKMNGIPNVSRSASIAVFGLGPLGTALMYLRQLRSKTVYATVYTQQKGGGPGLNHIAADGGIMGQASRFPLKRFADGGFSKPTSAHIASAGSYVMYAEKETGGEAFIPLASSKRARSLQIWKETGRRLNAYADGGFAGAADGVANGNTYNITNHYPQAEPNSTALNRAAQITTVRDRG